MIKKWIVSLMVLALFMIPVAASAAPAPALTNLQYTGITSDGNNFIWENISPNQTVANVTLTGTKGYISVYAQGTMQAPNYPVLRQNGSMIPTTQSAPNQFITGPGNIVVGTVYYRSFDLNDVHTGNISVTANNFLPPNRTFTDTLYITVQ
ncbi:DUF4879 domain-containing protein [Paenibacillus sp. FSL L8-0436]|uniref:DUF4879 domain-containing protein n=1 Tax=Paenibacillus sp. FSL L8-0436 TaxID=2954686 RepID=UPI003158FDD6